MELRQPCADASAAGRFAGFSFVCGGIMAPSLCGAHRAVVHLGHVRGRWSFVSRQRDAIALARRCAPRVPRVVEALRGGSQLQSAPGRQLGVPHLLACLRELGAVHLVALTAFSVALVVDTTNFLWARSQGKRQARRPALSDLSE